MADYTKEFNVKNGLAVNGNVVIDSSGVIQSGAVPSNISTHVSSTSNPHSTTAAQVGAEPSGSVSTHNSAIDAHSDIRSELLSLSDDIPSDPLPREADTLEGHDASYYTTYSDTAVSNHNISGTAHSDIRSQLAQIGTPDTINLENIILNGDLSDGTNNFIVVAGCTIAAASNILSITGDGSNVQCWCQQQRNDYYKNGHKIYGKAKVRVTNSSCLLMHLYVMSDDWGQSNLISAKATPISEQWYDFSGVVTLATAINTIAKYALMHQYADAATANGKTMQVQYFVSIDLTDCFGSGNEPDASYMDNLLDRWTNSYFAGTKSVSLTDYIMAQVKYLKELITSYHP